MQKPQPLWRLYRVFWSLFGRYAWDDQSEPARVSDPPKRVVEIVQTRCIKLHERVLDAGCGTGNYAVALATARFQVIGVDFAPGMLAQAQQKVTAALSQYVSFQTADLNAPLRFPTAHFDHVISISVLQAVASPNFTLGELHRVLRPRGTIVLSLPRQDSQVLSQPVSELLKYRIRHLERRTPGKMLLVVLKCLADRYHRSPRWTLAQTQTMLAATGFEILELEEGRQILAVAEKVRTTAGMDKR